MGKFLKIGDVPDKFSSKRNFKGRGGGKLSSMRDKGQNVEFRDRIKAFLYTNIIFLASIITDYCLIKKNDDCHHARILSSTVNLLAYIMNEYCL